MSQRGLGDTFANDDRGTGRSGDGAPQSLGALVRSWPWAMPLVLGAVIARLVAVAGIHLYRYFDSAEYEKLDFSGRWRRPWTTPLLYQLLPDSDAAVVAGQALIGAFAWVVLAFAVAALFQRRNVRVTVAVLALATGCTAVVTNWDTTMLSEPMAISLTVLVLAAWTDFVRRPTTVGAIAIVAASIPWMFVRQSLMPTAWMTVLFALAMTLGALSRHRSAGAAVPQIALVAGLAVGCVWATVSYSRNQEIIHHNITAIVTDRIAPKPGARKWFVDRGMPMPVNGRTDFLAFDQDVAFQRWVAKSGNSTYLKFLATSPWYSVTAPLADFVGANRSFREVPPFADPKAPPVTMLASAEPYGSSRTVLPGPLEDVLLRGGAVGSVLCGLVVAAGWTFARREDADGRWAVPAATVVLAALSLYAAWHGASTELPRLGLPGAVALRIAVVTVLGLLVEVELNRRDLRRGANRH